MNLSDDAFSWSFAKDDDKFCDSSVLSPSYSYTSPSSYSSTSMDSGNSAQDSPLHSENVTDHMQNFYNMNYQCFESQLGNTLNYQETSQPYTFSTSAVSTSTVSEKYCVPSSQETFKAELKIIEQPKTIFRFRYETEMQGPHGMIQAKQHSKNQKVYPTVKLNVQNYNENTKFMVKCCLYQFEQNEDSKELHPHKLIMRSGDFEKCDPHYVEVSKNNNFTAVFQGLGIIQTKKDNMKNIILQKCKSEMKMEQNRRLTDDETKAITAEAERMIKKVNINQVRLGYSAFMKGIYDENWIQITDLILSDVINNKKSGKVGDLKICRMSACAGEAEGNQEIFIFVSKVDKNTIKVRFFETDSGDAEGLVEWESYGRFSPSDVHHQFGIVFKTPPYKHQNIETNVKVFIQLFRSSDSSTSEALPFTYKPNSHNRSKRKRMNNDDTVIPTVVHPYESMSANISSSTFQQQSQQQFSSSANENLNTSQSFNSQQDQNENETELNVLLRFIDYELSANSPVDDPKSIKYFVDFTKDFGLTIDAPKTNRIDTDSANFPILEKLKITMKLFRDQYDNDKIKEMMEILIKSAEEKDENLLIDVIQYGTMNDIKELILILVKYQLFDVFKSKNEIDQNALHLAANLGFTSLVKVFIKFGVDYNATDAFGMSPLHLAVERNSLSLVKELLSDDRKVKLDDHDDNGNTPLITSVEKNNIEIAQTLIKYGANIGKQNPTNGYSCLHVALHNDIINEELLKYLIETDKTLLSLENHEGKNALEFAYVNKLPTNIVDLIASFYENVKEIIDDICLEEICEIFNKNDKWKTLAIRLDLNEHIGKWVTSSSPAKELFVHLLNSKKTLHDFIEILEIADDEEREEALNAIDEMVVRQFNNM